MARCFLPPYSLPVRFPNLLCAALLGGLCAVAVRVDASPPGSIARRPTAIIIPIAASIGAPNSGRLVAGVRLAESEQLRILPILAARDVRWGLPGLIHLLERVSKTVNSRFPSSVLSVGDISRKSGGSIGQHRSHQSGRDVDIGFYAVDNDGKAVLHSRFLRFDGDGRTVMLDGVHFDDARNWALIEAMLTDSSTRIQKIFVASWIRARLLRFAEHENASASLRSRAAEVMAQPRVGSPHDDHFHVRVECPANMRGTCDELPRFRSERVVSRPAPDTRTRVRTGSRDVPTTADKARGATNVTPLPRIEEDSDDVNEL